MCIGAVQCGAARYFYPRDLSFGISGDISPYRPGCGSEESATTNEMNEKSIRLAVSRLRRAPAFAGAGYWRNAVGRDSYCVLPVRQTPSVSNVLILCSMNKLLVLTEVGPATSAAPV